MHTIAPPKENAVLDITHAIGVEKLDREEREVIHMPEYPLIHSCISLMPECLFSFNSCLLLKRVLIYIYC